LFNIQQESTAASKNPEEQNRQITSIDGSSVPTGVGREDDPNTHAHNIVLMASFRDFFHHNFLF
jgi:hypothetical protein